MNEEEKEKERIFLELQAEIQAGLKAYERGGVHSSRRRDCSAEQ